MHLNYEVQFVINNSMTVQLNDDSVITVFEEEQSFTVSLGSSVN